MKTYSLCLKTTASKMQPYWITNWGKYFNPSDINWEAVEAYVSRNTKYCGYGYMYGHDSHNLTASSNRRVLWETKEV